MAPPDANVIEINRLRKARALANAWRQTGYGSSDLKLLIKQSGYFEPSGAMKERTLARDALSRLLTAASILAGRTQQNLWTNASEATWKLVIELLEK
jgi:hypothetical protein